MNQLARVDFERFELAEGVRLWVLPDRRFKNVAMRAFVHRSLDDLATLTALLPSVLRRGCRRQPTMAKIAAFLENLYGATYGADVHKLGERHVLSFAIDVVHERFVSGSRRLIAQAVEFLARVMREPVREGKGLKREYVEGEKANLKRFIEGLVNDRGTYAHERCVREMCRGEPFERYEYGSVEDLPSITPQRLAEFHRELWETAPIEFFVAGDVAPERMAKLFGRTFRFRRRRVRALAPPVLKPAPPEPREVVERMDVEQGHLVLGARAGATWADEGVFAVSFANGVLGAFPHSKLFRNVREQEGLAYAASSSFDAAKGLIFINAGIAFAKYADARRVIAEQLDAIRQGDVSAEEMDKTRATLINRVRSRNDAPSARIAFFDELQAYDRILSPEEHVARIEAISKDEVVRAAQRIGLDTIYFLTHAT
ncbi:MAG: insulinase family protein [Planctomycetes bacterium]|nr:insulinase family protein [Planctomycetota bacterium]